MTIHHLVDLDPSVDEATVTASAPVAVAIPPVTVDAHDVAVGDVIFGIGCEAPVGWIGCDGVWWTYATSSGIGIARRRIGSRVQVVRR